MLRQTLKFKQEIIGKLLKGNINKQEASQQLTCTSKTIDNYLIKVINGGLEALNDHRSSNNRKVTKKEEAILIQAKRKGCWRSARKVIEITGITTIGIRQIQRMWVKYGLNHVNRERLKPITRFVAKYPNDLWQADIMGKMYFPHLGAAYLIANLDDCSRFILGAKWFSRQTQINVFRVWYRCLFRYGIPKAMLQDKGSQYRSANPKGEATYQYFAQLLNIKLIFAHRAQTKGKIERIWRFIQQDFVRENRDVRSFEELNQRFFIWQQRYNKTFQSSGLGMNGKTPASVYQPSSIKRPKQELQTILTITIRRYVYRDSTISLFGVRYKIPLGYIGCRIWLHLKGDKVSLESMGKIICRFKLRV